MAVNRIRPYASSLGQSSVATQNAPSASGPTPWVAIVGGSATDVAAQQYLYRLAYEQARQALAPQRHLERLFSNWN